MPKQFTWLKMKLRKVEGLPEGEFFNKWLYNRLIKNNKNVLGVETGATGSGKSYRDLRKAELWYKYHFKEEFPIKNICFGVSQVMERLASGEMRKGEVLIFEEAGVSLGSLDFQNKVSKMFGYILQSFRSMNVALFMNLPYQNMLNKTARTLLHYTSESDGIDFGLKLNRCKPKFNQVNQSTGKIYQKYRNIRHNGRFNKIKRLQWYMPEERLILAYERKKAKYLANLTQEFTKQLRIMEQESQDRMARDDLTEVEQEYYDDWVEGLTIEQSANKRGKNNKTIWEARQRCKRKGFGIEISKNTRKNGNISPKTHQIAPLT